MKLVLLIVLCLCGMIIAVLQENDASKIRQKGLQFQPHQRSNRQSGFLNPFLPNGWQWGSDQEKSLPLESYVDLEEVYLPIDEDEDADPLLVSPSLVHNNQLGDDGLSVEERLNWREAQLAHLHGLGPAEISALSTWQHRLQPGRQQHPTQSKRLMPPAAAGSGNHHQGLHHATTSDGHVKGDANQFNSSQSRENETRRDANLLPLWPKRSAATNNKVNGVSGTRGDRNRSRKEDAAKKGKVSSRKKQQQEESRRARGRDANGAHQSTSVPDNVSRMNRNLATQFLLRSPRENRQYDVPIIECPPAEDGMERFACPTQDLMGRYRCIDDHVLCDGFYDCPGAEDEDKQACMFYKTMKAHLDLIADALLRWVRGR